MFPVSQQHGHEANGVDALAARLRLIHADSAGEPAEARRGRLCDEVVRALEAVPPQERGGFVRALAGHFAWWDGAIGGTEPSPTFEAQLNDPAFLAERLARVASSLPSDQREAIAARLAAAGLGAKGGAGPGGCPVEPMERLAAALKAGDDLRAEPGRVVDLAAMLVELVARLDQLAWSTWRAMSSHSEIKRRGPLQDLIRRYLAGDSEVSRGQVAEEVDRLRALTGALLAATSRFGFIAYRQAAKFSPSEIEAVARPEKKAFESLEGACWRKYRQLSGGLDQSTVEAEVLAAVSETVETLMRGLGR